MTLKKPDFMKNKDWFYFDEIEFRYKLTEKATEKARESYREFYRLLESRYKSDIPKD